MSQSLNDEAAYRTAPATPGLLKILFHNKFAFGEYVHVDSGALKVWAVKCLQITKLTKQQKNSCHGI